MSIRKDIVMLLQGRNFGALTGITANLNRVLNKLISLTYDKKDTIAWRAIEAIGFIAKECERENPELVRSTAVRLLWMIRDESGGIGWSSPEILGEIVRNCPSLCGDFAPIILSFHTERMLCAGTLRAAGRIGRTVPAFPEAAVPIVMQYLGSADESVRGNAAWSLGELGNGDSISALSRLTEDPATTLLYEDGQLLPKTIGSIAEQSLHKLQS